MYTLHTNYTECSTLIDVLEAHLCYSLLWLLIKLFDLSAIIIGFKCLQTKIPHIS